MCVCVHSPHSAESQEAIEQCMQQIIGHIWAKGGHWRLSGSLPLLSWTFFRSAEKQKKTTRQKITVIHKTLQLDAWEEQWVELIFFRLFRFHQLFAYKQPRNDWSCLQESARKETETGPRAVMSLPRFSLLHQTRRALASIWIQIQYSFYVR